MPSWPVQRPYKRYRQVRAGDWILIFGTASRVLVVGTHRAYPHAILLRLHPAGHADDVQTLVPADYEPVLLSSSGRTADRC